MIFKKSAINFAMIQTVLLATSINVGVQIPTTSGPLMAIGFVWILAFCLTFLPSIAVSVLFAYLSEQK